MSELSVGVARINELIAFFGQHMKAALRAEKRGAMTSVLFDLPRRSVLGWQLKYEHDPVFMREVAAVLPPEELGRRLKVLGSRPYYLQLFLLLQDTLGARQQRLLELGLEEGDPFPEERLDDLAFVVDYWERASRAYRNDGLLLPDEAGRTQPILPPEALDDVRGLLQPLSDGELSSARQLAGTLEAYCFVAHGEQRDGIFGHGPYEGDGGRALFFKEFNDLRNDFLPWSASAKARNELDAVIFAFECRDLQVSCDMFGGIVTEPLEFGDHVERIAVLAREGDEVRPLSPGQWQGTRERCTEATNEIYFAIVDWPQRFRFEYGAWLFANHIRPFLQLAGIDADDRLADAARDTIARHADRALEGPDTPQAMVHWGTTEGPLFWPVVE